MYELVLKRVLDIVFAACLLLVSCPVMVAVAVAIRLDDGGAFLFRQKRVGRNCRDFTLYKFRSMPVGTKSIASSDAATVKTTGVGKFIRRTNLDELPQLYNILIGDMSLVGPRPALQSQEELVSAREAGGVYEIRPGLTGLAQVNAYDGMPEAEKVSWDKSYRKSLSFVNDMKIMMRTFAYLLKPPPIY